MTTNIIVQKKIIIKNAKKKENFVSFREDFLFSVRFQFINAEFI